MVLPSLQRTGGGAGLGAGFPVVTRRERPRSSKAGRENWARAGPPKPTQLGDQSTENQSKE